MDLLAGKGGGEGIEASYVFSNEARWDAEASKIQEQPHLTKAAFSNLLT